MKILKIFGFVVGIHVFALVLIFANPGCSSTTKPPPAPADTALRAEPPPSVSVPSLAPTGTAAPAASSSSGSSMITFNPDAPATAAPSHVDGRYTPTRPGTPAAGTLVTEPVTDVTPATTYTVKSGDSLWTIAKHNHLTAAELAAANNLKLTAVLRPGQKLMIPGKSAGPSVAMQAVPSAPAPKLAETPATTVARSNKELRHVVKAGETLGAIARKYGVPAREIAVANNITDPAKIKADTELIIPGWETPSGKSGKTSLKAPKAAETRTQPPVEQPAATSPAAPAQPPPVPVIRIDDSPISPAPAPKN